MSEGRLSPESAWDDYQLLIDKIEAEILDAISDQNSPRIQRSIVRDMQNRSAKYMAKRFAGDGEFRAYLHTRKTLTDTKATNLDGQLEVKEVPEYYDNFIIASGGSEVEYIVGAEAEDGTPIAIKLLKHELNSGYAHVFHKEQRVLAKLQEHYSSNYPPNLIKLYAQAEGLTVTERIPGAQNLYNKMLEREKGVSIEKQLFKRIGYFKDIVAGLTALYEAGFEYHGDLKLENCILGSDGFVRVCDFSLVDEMANKSVERYKSTSGTPQYMSAERCIHFTVNGETAKIDKRADVFALGVMLHQLLTLGKDPFNRHTLSAENKKFPHAWFVTAFGGFIGSNNLSFVDHENRSYTKDRLAEFGKTFAHHRLAYH